MSAPAPSASSAPSAIRARALGFAIAALVAAIDQGFKAWVVYGLHLRQVGTIHILPFFDLHWVQNFGVSLGLFTSGTPEGRYGLLVMTGAIACFVAVWLLRERKRGDIAALGLVLGGAMGNIWDRFKVGYVIDYADLHFGEWRPFLVFNIADAAITIGVLIILARSLLSREKPDATGETAPEAQ